MAAIKRMDVLYLYKHSKNAGFEIRYSLRSVEQHLSCVRKVWIYGDKPPFLSNDTSIVEHVPHEVTAGVLNVKIPVTNFFLQMFLSSLIPDLLPEYLLFADDYYLLKDLSLAEARKDRYLEDLAHVKSRGTGLWKDALWRTYDTLKRFGYPGYNFETHVPTYLTRKRVLAAYLALKDFTSQDRFYGLLGITAVLNHAKKHENMSLTSIFDEKSRCGFWDKQPTLDAIIEQSKEALFFNHDDDAFGDPIRSFLMERFPTPSRYEA